MPTDRAGYTLSVYAIDVSTSMGEPGDDPDGGKGKGKGKTKLDLVKEFVARRCEPKVRDDIELLVRRPIRRIEITVRLTR
jgi:ATP-dependent DNA helicase 2 subunit 2